MPTAVERVIAAMWQQYDQPFTLAEMADEAIFSRFYFSRVFRAETGTSPGRFLTMIRLYKAKNLLLQTSASVTDISYRVGYNSPGTFSTRFTLSVGLSPARYRQEAHRGIGLPARAPVSGGRAGRIACRVSVPGCGVPTRTYIGVFRSPHQQGTPVACQVADGSRLYHLENVPDGPCAIRAVTVPTVNLDPRPWERHPLFASDVVETSVSDGRTTAVNLQMRPVRFTDIPVLLALPELDNVRLQPGQRASPNQWLAVGQS